MAVGSPSSPAERWPSVQLKPLLFVWATTLAVHAGAVGSFFALDDVVWLLGAAGIEPSPAALRPVAVGMFRLEHALFGLSPLGYHVVNLALHLFNASAVYFLARRLTGSAGQAQAAGILFGASAIVFTPLHWVVGISDLLECALLLSATLLYLKGRTPERRVLLWVSAAVGFAAVLGKEAAIAWPLFVAFMEWGPPNARTRAPRRVLPVALAFIVGAAWLVATLKPARTQADAYGTSLAPGHLATNLATYLAWILSPHEPIRDRWALPDPRLLPWGLAGLAAFAAGAWFVRRRSAAVLPGAVWFFVFLLPVLPLSNHTYLYYLYVPWAGAAVAVAAGAGELVPRKARRVVATVSLAAFVVLEWSGVQRRERLAERALPIDPTVRQALLLRNAIHDLRAMKLPPGSMVGFVNPLSGPGINLMQDAPTPRTPVERASYYVLESVLREGRTLQLFAPGLRYAGISRTIPPTWNDVDVLVFEQRGYVRHWGRGQQALEQQQIYLEKAAGEQ